jgi:hypothetical protein
MKKDGAQNDQQLVTRKDLTEALEMSRKILRKEFREDLSEVAQTILSALGDKFEKQEETINRNENKLNATADIVDDHEGRLKLLEATSS